MDSNDRGPKKQSFFNIEIKLQNNICAVFDIISVDLFFTVCYNIIRKRAVL